MSYSMRFVVTPLPTSDDSLHECIKDAAIRTPRTISQQQQSQAQSQTSQQTQQHHHQQQQQQQQNAAQSGANNTTTFNAIKSTPVSQITVGPRHIAILLENGRIGRASYQVLGDRLEFPPSTHTLHAPTSNQMSSSSISTLNSAPNNAAAVAAAAAAASLSSASTSHINSQTNQQPPQQHSHTNSPMASVSKATISAAVNASAANNPNSTPSSISTSASTSNANVGGSGGGAGGGGSNPSSAIGSVISSAASMASGAGNGGANVSGSSSSHTGNTNQTTVVNVSGNVSSAPGNVTGPGPVPAPNVPPFPSRVNISPQVGGLSVQHRQAARRGRMLRQTASRGRGATSVIMGSRAVIPAQYVPEDLINQAQVVLQGKPRSAIVRELQRTNLDVNSAVNNLLSSDNEDPEDMDESQDYLPNEDLMSLLDSSVNLPSGPTSVLIDAETVFPEDVFNSYSASRIRPNSIRHSVGSGRGNSDRESSLASELEIRRMANRDSSQGRRWLEHALRDPPSSDNHAGKMNSATPTDFTLHHKSESNQSTFSKKASTTTPEMNPIQISETIEMWPGDKKFVQIACMHSELIAISSTGQIHQWKWSEPMPFEGIRHGDVMNYHPKAAHLNLTHEKVQLLSASCIRATVVTETSKIATWIDSSINIVASKLEQPAQNYPEFQRNDKISQLRTCSLYTCIRLESGAMYWWGVAPFSQRKKNWKKIQSKACKPGSVAGSNEISVGSVVCLKNGPSFGDGAIGFTTKDGIPRVGRLTMSAWNITDTCSFKIIQNSEKRSSASNSSAEPKPQRSSARKMSGQPLDFSGSAQEEQAPPSPGIPKNSSSERLEMPPPPSPASSTCSEPGCSPSHKRKHKHLLSMKDEFRDEEQWNLKDVIFLEEVKKPPLAKVVKLDNNTALVRFNQRDPFGHQAGSDVNAYLEECRMIRKDELRLAKTSEATSSSRIIDCQRSPKKLSIPDSCNFLTFTVSNNGIHALVKTGQKIEYKMYQLASGKVSKSLYFPTDTNAFLGRDSSLITLYACGESDVAVTLRDGNGSLYPLAKDFMDSLKEPHPLDMAPVQAMGMAVHPLRDPNNPNRTNPTLVMAMALEYQILIPAVLRSDPEYVKITLASLSDGPASQQLVASEKIDLNRNVLHAAVYSCAPTPTKGGSDRNRYNEDPFDTFGSGPSHGSMHDSMKRSRSSKHTSSSSASYTLDLSSDSNEARYVQRLSDSASFTQSRDFGESVADQYNSIFGKFDIDPTEQKQSAYRVLLILVQSSVLQPFLKDLMIQKDVHAMTPFMSAVSCRAYTAALILLDLARWIVDQETAADQEKRNKLFYSMIFPSGSNLDNNPLYMLCANDTCSFTWTGAQHINQDIFECKTCGLTRTLCCCTECARTCHKGHDCRLKKTSPTAYCDCWEKCKCKSLVAGSHFTRFKLLERLLTDTDLVTYPDSRGESILLFLVQTVGRQIIEQRQYGPDRSSRHSKRDEPPDMPDHDLAPPRFARKALHKMLGEWLALKSVIMSGTSLSHNLAGASRVNPLLNTEDQIFLSCQQGTALLDRFTHSLLIKIGPEMLDVLLTTIIRESSSSIPGRTQEARLVAKRFVRSVARNGVVLSVELSPVNYSQQSSMFDMPSTFNPTGSSPYNASGSSWKPNQQPASILQKCRKVFQALLLIAAEELAEIADALLSPVRLGVPRPTAPFSLVTSMAEATQGSEEIFVVEPVVIPAATNMEDSSTNQPNPAPSSSGLIVSNTASSNAPQGNDSNPSGSVERVRDMLYDNDIAMETIDSEDAEASNNTFRRSHNGETDSESDSNADDASMQSNVDPTGARSTTTGATAGSEVGASTVAYFSEADSGDSSNADDDEESEGNDTEHDNDDLSFAHEDGFAFARRATIVGSGNPPDNHNMQHQSFRSTNLGQQLHWALRHRDQSFYHSQPNSSSIPTAAARLASMGIAGTYGYLDGAPARRSLISGGQSSSHLNTNHELSMSTTAVGLARAFSIIIRSISDLLPILKDAERSDSALTINQLRVCPTEAASIICNIERKLNPIWEWLFKVMDSTEGQLRFGCALRNGIQAASQVAAASSGQQMNQQQSPQLQPRNMSTGPPILNNPIHPVPNAYHFPQTAATGLLPVHQAMLARVNANLSAHNLNRRMPNLFDDARSHSGPSGMSGSSSGGGGDAANIRLHNPIGQSSGITRPQSLTTRPNLAGPTYITRMQPLNDPGETVDGTAARRDFLSYMISLIRGHGNEHHDSLPILDVSSLRHVAYVFDAYIYYLRSLNRNKDSPKPSVEDNSDEDDLTSLVSSSLGSRSQFFRRSESTLSLDSLASDPFNLPLSEALPLAEQPHLLQPNSRREDLFGVAKSSLQDVDLDSLPIQLSLSTPPISSCPKCLARQHAPQTQAANTSKLGFNTSNLSRPGQSHNDSDLLNQSLCPTHRRDTEFKTEMQYTQLLGRWRLTVELFGREFLDDVGAEPGSILTNLVGFPMKENRFRKDMERLRYESATREISLINVDRDKNILIKQTIKELNNAYHLSERNQSRRNLDLPLLACSKVKVSFRDEKGEGNGVARSFYTAFCEAVLSNEQLANLDAPLFYQPGLRNFYSPRQGEATPDRNNAFRNVGRIIGICLSQSEICPIQLNRHVIKYILRKPISWHDLAFFDPVLYESLRQLVVDAETSHSSPMVGGSSTAPANSLQALDLRFYVDMCAEEGGGQVELVPGGKDIEVNRANIYEYVRRYALRRMVKSQEKALAAIRQGVMDVLPASALDNLTAEDFRLLLNGVGEINIQTLISYTSFIDDRGASAGKQRSSVHVDEQLAYFKRWFWSIVEKMTTKERQDLVYFWTGSPSLPASEEGFQPMPTVSIRPAEDLHLPTSNVCIFRLYIPLYSSKAILRSKLLIAIKEKNFGFI